MEEAYRKYIGDVPSDITDELFVHDPRFDEGDLSCPRCQSTKLDRRAGYQGEYKCRNCGYFWRRA